MYALKNSFIKKAKKEEPQTETLNSVFNSSQSKDQSQLPKPSEIRDELFIKQYESLNPVSKKVQSTLKRVVNTIGVRNYLNNTRIRERVGKPRNRSEDNIQIEKNPFLGDSKKTVGQELLFGLNFNRSIDVEKSFSNKLRQAKHLSKSNPILPTYSIIPSKKELSEGQGPLESLGPKRALRKQLTLMAEQEVQKPVSPSRKILKAQMSRVYSKTPSLAAEKWREKPRLCPLPSVVISPEPGEVSVGRPDRQPSLPSCSGLGVPRCPSVSFYLKTDSQTELKGKKISRFRERGERGPDSGQGKTSRVRDFTRALLNRAEEMEDDRIEAQIKRMSPENAKKAIQIKKRFQAWENRKMQSNQQEGDLNQDMFLETMGESVVSKQGFIKRKKQLDTSVEIKNPLLISNGRISRGGASSVATFLKVDRKDSYFSNQLQTTSQKTININPDPPKRKSILKTRKSSPDQLAFDAMMASFVARTEEIIEQNKAGEIENKEEPSSNEQDQEFKEIEEKEIPDRSFGSKDLNPTPILLHPVPQKSRLTILSGNGSKNSLKLISDPSAEKEKAGRIKKFTFQGASSPDEERPPMQSPVKSVLKAPSSKYIFSQQTIQTGGERGGSHSRQFNFSRGKTQTKGNESPRLGFSSPKKPRWASEVPKTRSINPSQSRPLKSSFTGSFSFDTLPPPLVPYLIASTTTIPNLKSSQGAVFSSCLSLHQSLCQAKALSVKFLQLKDLFQIIEGDGIELIKVFWNYKTGFVPEALEIMRVCCVGRMRPEKLGYSNLQIDHSDSRLKLKDRRVFYIKVRYLSDMLVDFLQGIKKSSMKFNTNLIKGYLKNKAETHQLVELDGVYIKDKLKIKDKDYVDLNNLLKSFDSISSMPIQALVQEYKRQGKHVDTTFISNQIVDLNNTISGMSRGIINFQKATKKL